MSKRKDLSRNSFKDTPAGMAIPYYYQGLIWKVRILKQKANGELPEIGEEQYYTIPGSGEALFQADDIKMGFPVVLVDEEWDALSVKQEAGNITAAVALGGLQTARLKIWVDLLERASVVLVSFPKTGEGQEATRWWLDHLTYARSWPVPYPYQSANAMLVANADINGWVRAGIKDAYNFFQPS